MVAGNTLELYLLGGFKAHLGSRRFEIKRYRLERALLVFLAVESSYPHWRTELADLFWPDQIESVGRTNLRQVLAGLRKALGDCGQCDSYVIVTPDTVQFNKESKYWVDLEEYLKVLDAVQVHQHDRVIDCQSCINKLNYAYKLYRGNFLNGHFLSDSRYFQEWVICHNERIVRQQIWLLKSLASIRASQGEKEKAVECLCELLNIDPYNEFVHHWLMELYFDLGRRIDALLQYELCSEIFERELGIQPTVELSILYERIKSGTLPA